MQIRRQALDEAASKLAVVEDLKAEGDGRPVEVHTPGDEETIEDVAKFLGVSPRKQDDAGAEALDENRQASARAVV